MKDELRSPIAPWPPALHDMATWMPRAHPGDAAEAFVQLERRELGRLRRFTGLALALTLLIVSVQWMG